MNDRVESTRAMVRGAVAGIALGLGVASLIVNGGQRDDLADIGERLEVITDLLDDIEVELGARAIVVAPPHSVTPYQP